MLTLGFVLQTLLNDYRPTGQEPTVASVVIDSREARPGSLFVAFAGEQADGHQYVANAFERGAVAALVERPVEGLPVVDLRGMGTQRNSGELGGTQEGKSRIPNSKSQEGEGLEGAINWPVCLLVESTMKALQALAKAWRARFEQVRVIGITGSIGKTSTKELAHAVLSRRFRTLKSEGNLNNEIGLPLTLLQLRPEHERAVLEMGTYGPGEIALLADLAKPSVGVVTNIGPVHLERMGSLDVITAAKSELVAALPAGPAGVAILNQDDERVMTMTAQTQARIFTYGLVSSADLWADNIQSMGLEGIHFRLHYGRENLNVQVPLLGRHSVHTSLRAAAVGLVEGLAWDEIVSGLRGLTSQLRLVAAQGPKQSVLLDDTYNSSPDSAIAALNLLADLDGRRVAVLGDMLELGSAEEVSHRLVGRRAKDVADLLVTVGRRARLMAEAALEAGMAPERVVVVEDAAAAVPVLEKLIEEKDFILVKGSRGVHLDRLVTALTVED
jgi:UDP-N-acetylmuramoyl-tripeptide--D-alanyl-D-alanine ligase